MQIITFFICEIREFNATTIFFSQKKKRLRIKSVNIYNNRTRKKIVNYSQLRKCANLKNLLFLNLISAKNV